MARVRLQKYLSECGVASRRRSEVLIERGRVAVNGTVVTELGTQVDPDVDRVTVKDKLIQPVEKGVLLFHKPTKVITTMDDPEGRPSLADYLANSPKYVSYFPVGRLDFESSGLVVLTNDGDLAQQLLHPKFRIERVYEVLVEGDLPDEVISKIEKGVELEDGRVSGAVDVFVTPHTEPPSTLLYITIAVGRNRIVRRLFDFLGYPVINLHRIQHGPFKLGNVRPGEIRKLTEAEYGKIRHKLLGRPPERKNKQNGGKNLTRRRD